MVQLSCGVQFSRGALAVLNILFLVFGFALLGFGIYLAASKKFDVAFFEDIHTQIIGGDAIQTIGIILIVVGICTVILSAVGCWGALRKQRECLYLYAVILTILMLSELAAFITAMSLRATVRDSYEDRLWNIFMDAYERNRTDISHAIDKLEEQFECCGVDGSKDYDFVNRSIPLSCYENQNNNTKLFENGCADAIIDWIMDEMPIIGGVIAAVFILEVFGVIASIALACAVSHYSSAESHIILQYQDR